MAEVGRRQIAVAHRKGNKNIAAGVFSAAPHSRQPDTGTLRQTGTLVWQQRRIGSDGYHDRTHARHAHIFLALKRGRYVIQHGTHRVTPHPQGFAHTIVGLHQRTDGPAPLLRAQHSRGCANATLELVTDHPCATAHIALLHRACPGILQGKLHMLGRDMLAPDIVQRAVVGFQHHRHAPVGVLLAQLTLGCHQRIAHHANTVGIGIGNRRSQQTGFANPLQPRGVAVAIEHMHAGEAGLQVGGSRTRLNHGDTGMDGNIAVFNVEGVMTHSHTRYVGDGVVRPRGARTDGDAKLTDTHGAFSSFD